MPLLDSQKFQTDAPLIQRLYMDIRLAFFLIADRLCKITLSHVSVRNIFVHDNLLLYNDIVTDNATD